MAEDTLPPESNEVRVLKAKIKTRQDQIDSIGHWGPGLLVCIALVMAAGCMGTTDDDRVLQVSHEGSDKIINHLQSINDASGSALQYRLTDIQKVSDAYSAKLAPLDPKTDQMIKLKEIEMRFFTNAGLWAKNYQKYLETGKKSDMDTAGLYKAKMMTAIDDFNDL